MSSSDAATSVPLRSLVPSVASISPSSGVVRWMLRATTAIVFTVATVVGISLALDAPTESPASIGGPRR
jgi:hypothetical protein